MDSIKDGEGNEIRVYLRKNPVIISVRQMAKQEDISEKEVYKKYGESIFQTTNAQSSIRTRIINYKTEKQISEDLLSIEYVPKTGKNKGIIYEQFYKGDKCRLFVWLKDTSEIIDGELYKKDLQGTYWDMNAWMKNVAKEGTVDFPNSKKPEKLISQIIDMTTSEGDYVLDSFLGSGTTSAVAHKMNRKWIGVEMGGHAYSLCKKRLDLIISGNDNSGITKDVNWQGGGGYKFYELAPSLIKYDMFDEPVINKEYDADMLAAAVALHEGFIYQPDEDVFWKQSVGNEDSYLFVTTNHITQNYLDKIHEMMSENEYLIIACKSFESGLEKRYSHIAIKKLPQMLLKKCEFDKDDYSLNIVHPPVYDEELES